MRLFSNKEILVFLVISGSFCCVGNCSVDNESTIISTDKNGAPNVDIIANNQQELNEETLGEVMKGFGEYLAGNMNEEMDKLLKEVEQGNGDKSDEKRSAENNNKKQQAGRIDLNELEKFRDIQHNIAKDTKTRIELVGQKNDGQLTQSWLSSTSVGQSSFLTKVNEHLQSAGAFISNQMSSLSNLVPKINGKVRSIPSKLRPLFRWPSFLRFKIRFNKVYKSSREELYRQMIYLNRQVVCGIQNVKYLFGRRSHLLRATEFSDITSKEYQQIYDNEEAERENSSSNGDDKFETILKLDETTKEKLRELAKENKNIFGKSMKEVIDKTISKNLSLRQKVLEELEEEKKSSSFLDRKKRSSEEDSDTEMIDALHNELDDEEESEYDEGELSDLEDDDMNEGKSEFFVDEFAAEYFENADKNQANELEDIMDEALGNADERTNDDFKQIDLRQTNCIITPENQDKCGCCYAHVTTAAASYFNCMQFGLDKAQRYNARFTSDCGRYLTPDGVRPRLDGCSGGKLSEAIKFTKLVGTHLFMEYEIARVSFDFKSDKCAYPKPEKLDNWASIQVPFFENTIFTNLRLSEVDLHLRTVGPVLVNLRTWKDFAYQGRGIYGKFEESENPTIHSMLIVGHDRDVHGRDYYIIWNSHGTAWGEQGYVRIYSESLEFFKVYLGGLLTTEAMNQIKSSQAAKS